MKHCLAAISLGMSLCLAAASAPTAAQGLGYAKQSEESARIGEAYITAYVALDWDRIEPLLADNATFHDPTAEHSQIFGLKQRSGKPAVMKGFREGYAGVTKMMLHRSRTFYSGNYSVFQGDLEWGLKFPDGRVVEGRTSFVAILRIENGKVVEHRDYVDYAPYLESEMASRPAKRPQE